MRALWLDSKALWADRDYYRTRLREKWAFARAVIARLYQETIAEVPEDNEHERRGGGGGETAWGGYR
jgi:hypothetical protein